MRWRIRSSSILQRTASIFVRRSGTSRRALASRLARFSSSRRLHDRPSRMSAVCARSGPWKWLKTMATIAAAARRTTADQRIVLARGCSARKNTEATHQICYVGGVKNAESVPNLRRGRLQMRARVQGNSRRKSFLLRWNLAQARPLIEVRSLPAANRPDPCRLLPVPLSPRPRPDLRALTFVWVVVLEGGGSGLCIPGATVEVVPPGSRTASYAVNVGLLLLGP